AEPARPADQGSSQSSTVRLGRIACARLARAGPCASRALGEGTPRTPVAPRRPAEGVLSSARAEATPVPRRVSMKGAAAVAEILKREGVQFLIGYPVNTVIEASAQADIRTIIVRQERTGLHMADAV